MRRTWPALLLLLAAGCASPRAAEPPPGDGLQRQLEQLTAGFRGRVGVYVEHLVTGERAELAADELFPTASMIKLPILLGVFERLERGELSYQAPLAWERSRIVDDEDLLAQVADGAKLPLSKLVTLMETFSDNSASIWCQELAGGGEELNRWLDAQGYRHTRVNSRTFGRRGDWEQYGWGQTTPREMARLMVHARRRASEDAAGEELYRALTRSYWTAEALSEIPPWVHTASKQGAVDRSRSEVVLVGAPHGEYVFCVVTREQEDTSWTRDNEGYELLRRVSALLWRHFEPGSGWTPAPGAERFAR